MSSPFTHHPPPWLLHGDIYTFFFYTFPSTASSLPPHTYHPLEASSSYADPSLSKPIGGLSAIQLLRYHDSPVGPYDEMIVIPGYFEYFREDSDGRRRKKRNAKITRIYVSQEETCYNGRLNWNVPKHLATFTWTPHPNSSISLTVQPHDSPTPFFRTAFIPQSYLPRIPFSSSWLSTLGFDTTLVLPPLPAGDTPELVATQKWRAVRPGIRSRECRVGWFDMRQDDGDGGNGRGNFWPGLGRWQLGMAMMGAEITFGVPEEWEAPRSTL